MLYPDCTKLHALMSSETRVCRLYYIYIYNMYNNLSFAVFMRRNFRRIFRQFRYFYWSWIQWAYLCWLQQLEVPFITLKRLRKLFGKSSVPTARGKTACVPLLLRQWESELDFSSDILQCLNAVSSYEDYWIFYLFAYK